MKKRLIIAFIICIVILNGCANHIHDKDSPTTVLDTTISYSDSSDSDEDLEPPTDTKLEINILEHMQDGLDEPSLVDFYEQEIHDVHRLDNGTIIIRYYTVDLNEDGLDDKIVSLISPLHSGSHGDTFEILINNGTSYSKLSSLTIRLWHQDSELLPIGSVYVLKSMTDGFHDIEITSDEVNITLQYKNDFYQMKE